MEVFTGMSHHHQPTTHHYHPPPVVNCNKVLFSRSSHFLFLVYPLNKTLCWAIFLCVSTQHYNSNEMWRLSDDAELTWSQSGVWCLYFSRPKWDVRRVRQVLSPDNFLSRADNLHKTIFVRKDVTLQPPAVITYIIVTFMLMFYQFLISISNSEYSN